MDEFKQANYFQQVAELSKKYANSKEYKSALKILFECWERGGVVFTMGCGGSASTATHFAADLAKTTISGKNKGFKTVGLIDNIPLVSAWTNDKGWGTVFSGQLAPWLTKKDVLVGFSVHGGAGEGDAGPWSQNLVQAMTFAQKKGAKIIGFSGFDGGAMKKMADVCLLVPTTSEVYGTGLVEGFHSVIAHGLIFCLKEQIKNVG
ncbi:MAG: hypothetical protein A3A58_01200 [Candidatus Blackburnbacteria bacterium RIFCSPLOWO2_01_FULL_41_27]|uniref:SIS domain-containing protein n=2 Tax=Candidatus Blackburniibacteriota TaxID=1817898 RepID=A0A1G1VCA0_9BACT|nr:MAG: hypothetical protein A3F61_00875 [Candidatus Blackburnbacteria bacterium RIFCSPHIGHO2_12_FULL_41_13b]OGY13870.1 MAG: hypothetical protein A3A58_01200 [Candidatus Blackburnbacteria bacterium RIFCSPLOWO2_01_FULL_41_27]